MASDKILVNVNSNYHHVSGEDLFEGEDARHREYRARWHQWPENFNVGPFPIFLDIEVTSDCNLKCPFCATTFRAKKIKKGYIDFDIMKKIIDEGAEKGLYGIKFNIRGEPLLHPRLHDFVGYAKDKGLIDVYFNTNGVLLTEEVSKRLIGARLDRITISAEGYTKNVYERYRVGSDFEQVVNNVKTLQALKKKSGAKRPKVRIQTVMLPELEPYFEEYRAFWSDLADEVSFLDYKRMKSKKTGIVYPWACPQVWQRMAIWWDGTILPCNHDDEGILRLGNCSDTTIEEAWHSEKVNEVRETHKSGCAHTIPACDGCYLRDSEIAKVRKGL